MKFQITGGEFLRHALKETAKDMKKRIKKNMEIQLRINPPIIDRREAVNHPRHYGGADNPYEAIKVIEAWDLGFCLGSVVKYICRHGKKAKSAPIEDLKKARWYLDREIRRREGTL